MGNTVAIVAVVVVVAGVAGAAPVASSAGPAGETAAQETATNDTDAMAPGERLAGVVGAERAAVESEVAVRAFGHRIAAANSSTAKARVVGEQVEDMQARLDELDAERAELRRAHENGTISTGQYRARLAKLYAEERALQRLANRTERVARGLPDRALREQGVNVTAIRTLRSNAHNLTGPEVAEIARTVAGKSVGRPADGGPPEFATNESEERPGNGTSPGENGPPDDGESSNRPDERPAANETGSSGAGENGSQKPTDTAPVNATGGGDGAGSDSERGGSNSGAGETDESGN